MSTDMPKILDTKPVLVIGFGNPLCGDDGLGVAAVTVLRRRYRLPDEVEVLDGGTSSLGAYEMMANRSLLIAVDAVVCDRPAGTLVRLSGPRIPAEFGRPLSPHDLGFAETLALLETSGDYPDRLSVLGMVPGAINAGEGLGEAVKANMDALVRMIVDEICESGLDPVPLTKC